MALLLVPYNNAMRLGQGFNSFTQQICVDNAVVGLSDPEDPQPLLPQTYIPVVEPGTPAPVISKDKANLDKFLAANEDKVIRYPSQIVTYTSKYVSKLSDLSNDFNISGSLSIRYGEISGGGSGSYVNTDNFQSSDLNFLVQVKVINQTLNIKDQLVFWPIGNAKATEYNANTFTAAYGDSFISGFQEGGIFSALVSIRALKQEDSQKIAASAHVALQVGVGSLEAQGEVDKAKKTLNESSEVNITVNWSGGGQLKEGGEKWTIDTLQDVAVRFADLVAACPQRTHAILTKYTALRGYLQWKKDANYSPHDYEIANLYTSELLDVYMGYKAIWKEIHNMMDQLGQGVINLVKAEEPKSKISTPAKPAAGLGQTPIPGVELAPFAPDIEGLDKALQTCRSLMVRIVTENDDISRDPKFAIDGERPIAYIRPQVFRKLLPQISKLPVTEPPVKPPGPGPVLEIGVPPNPPFPGWLPAPPPKQP